MVIHSPRARGGARRSWKSRMPQAFRPRLYCGRMRVCPRPDATASERGIDRTRISRGRLSKGLRDRRFPRVRPGQTRMERDADETSECSRRRWSGTRSSMSTPIKGEHDSESVHSTRSTPGSRAIACPRMNRRQAASPAEMGVEQAQVDELDDAPGFRVDVPCGAEESGARPTEFPLRREDPFHVKPPRR